MAGPGAHPDTPGYRSPLLDELPGAAPAGGADAGIALHYGDPAGEQWALATGAGLVDRSNRMVLMVTGVDRMAWLDAVTAQDLGRLAGGRAAEALVLTPHGYVRHHMFVSNVGDTTWLNTEPGFGAALLDHLNARRYMLRIEVDDVSADWAVTSVVGPGSAAALTALGLVPPAEYYEVASLAGGGWMRRMPYPAGGSVDLTVPRRLLPQVAHRCARAGVAVAGVQAYEAMRVEALRPRLGWDTDTCTLPGEVGWLGVAARLDKGCYPGQVSLARAREQGRPRRRLVLLRLRDDPAESPGPCEPAGDLPARRAPVLLDGRRVGFVGTAVRHHALGPVALALVDAGVPRAAQVTVAGRAAAVEA